MEVPTTQPTKLEHGVDVASPCIKICKYRPNDNVCVGCGRTDAEITDWMFLSNAEKQQVIEYSTQRL
jgi:predicted Fe-S protein YdhL (DUF1289 family)